MISNNTSFSCDSNNNDMDTFKSGDKRKSRIDDNDDCCRSNDNNNDIKRGRIDEVKQINNEVSVDIKEQLVSSRKKYRIIEWLGSGSYSQVHKAIEIKTGHVVAIKFIDRVFRSKIHARRVLREMRILGAVDHPNIVKLLDVILPDMKDFSQNSRHCGIAFVLEHVDTDLSKLIRSSQHLSSLHVKYILYQILLGVNNLHSRRILHRDLKPANILVHSNCRISICDLGLARSIQYVEGSNEPQDIIVASSPFTNSENSGTPNLREEMSIAATDEQSSSKRMNCKKGTRKRRNMTKHVVTRYYRAPELVVMTGEYSEAVDMWSVGCIFAELLGMQVENVPSYKDRVPLFPDSFEENLKYFVSVVNSPASIQYQLRQLKTIFKVIGVPPESVLKRIMSEELIAEMQKWPTYHPIDFRKRFPGASHDALDLLSKLIMYDDDNRISVDHALSHPYLRDVALQSEIAQKPADAVFEFELPMTLDEIREAIIKAASKYPSVCSTYSSNT